MPDSNLEIVERLYQAFCDQDLDGVAATLHDDIVWSTSGAVPWGGTINGIDGVRAFCSETWVFFAEYRNEPREFIVHGGTIIVEGRHVVRTADGSEHVVPYRDACAIRDGVIVTWSQQVDAAAVQRAIAAELTARPRT